MPRETHQQKAERAQRIITELRKTYPHAHCELIYSNPLQLLIATILSAQCTDKQVNRVTPPLFETYRTAADFASAELENLEQSIKTLGFFRTKAKNLKACCQVLVDQHGGNVPKSLEALVLLPGVGRKTANVVLGNAFHENVGIVVDTHVGRLSQRLGLTSQQAPEKIEQDLIKLVPRKLWTMFSHWLIWHGRRRCSARKPDCSNCEILALCPTGRKTAAKPGK